MVVVKILAENPQQMSFAEHDDVVKALTPNRADLGTRGFPSPVELEALPMPLDHRLRPDDQQGIAPTAPELGQPDPEDSIPWVQPGTPA